MHAAKKRIMKIDPIDTSNIESVPDASSSKKVPFSNLLKKGLINPGEKSLTLKKI